MEKQNGSPSGLGTTKCAAEDDLSATVLTLTVASQ